MALSVGWNPLRVIERDISRETVIQTYARYDSSKKGLQTPDFATWDWSGADMIDREMCHAGLKKGVPAGYVRWDKVQLTISDIRQCAVEGGIFAGQPQRELGLIEHSGGLREWEAKLFQHLKDRGSRLPSWYDQIKQGRALDETAPLLLRPAVRSESPARWYIEDGSGRAITFVASQGLFEPLQIVAIGYLGQELDAHSSFMHAKFAELYSN